MKPKTHRLRHSGRRSARDLLLLFALYTCGSTLCHRARCHSTTKRYSRYAQAWFSIRFGELNRPCQTGLPTALAHLPHLLFLHVECPALVYRCQERIPLDQEETRERRYLGDEVVTCMLEAIRMRALRSLPDVVFRARPTLRVLAVGDDRPAFPPESESLAQDDLGAEHWKEYTDALNELRQLAAQGAPARQTRWWRVDGMGEERGLVEIWSAKGELAREVIERPHFDLDRDLHCEYPFAVVEHGWTSDELCGINRAISPISSLLRLLIMPVGCSSIAILQSVQREAPGHIYMRGG